MHIIFLIKGTVQVYPSLWLLKACLCHSVIPWECARHRVNHDPFPKLNWPLSVYGFVVHSLTYSVPLGPWQRWGWFHRPKDCPWIDTNHSSSLILASTDVLKLCYHTPDRSFVFEDWKLVRNWGGTYKHKVLWWFMAPSNSFVDASGDLNQQVLLQFYLASSWIYHLLMYSANFLGPRLAWDACTKLQCPTGSSEVI